MPRYAIQTVAYIEAASDDEARQKLWAVIPTLGFDMDVNESREFRPNSETAVREWCPIHGFQDFTLFDDGLTCPECIKALDGE